MTQPATERIRWRDNPDAVELGFDHYLILIEGRLRGNNVSLVQGLRGFYKEDLGIDLRETQARGLMHRESSVFVDYVAGIWDAPFLPNFEYWESQGLDHFLRWKEGFYQVRNTNAVDMDIDDQHIQVGPAPIGSVEPPKRRTTRVERVIRNSALSRFLKMLYSHECQICRFTFMLTSSRRYAETHHIKPLGQKHMGIDNESNMIVLCPNHHAMMDFGAVAIHPDDLTVIGPAKPSPETGERLQLDSHPISRNSLEYHLDHIFQRV